MKGNYYDGRSAARHEVEVILAEGAVIISNDRIRREDRLDTVRVSERLQNAPRTLTFGDGAVCELADDRELNTALGASEGRSIVDRIQGSWPAVLACSGLLLGVAFAGYRFGVPLFASYTAERMPPQVASHLTTSAMTWADKQLFVPSRLSAGRQDGLRRRFEGLIRPGESAPASSPLIFRASPAIGPNAFTLPDGSIVVLDELLALADTDDQLMAVLCHEAGHAHYQHGLRKLLQNVVIGAAIFAWIGDVNALIAGVSAVLLEARYSRDFEREADAYAVAMLKANGLSPERLAEMFEKLAAAFAKPDDKEENGIGSYLSTHPLSSERIAALKAAAVAAD